MTGTYKLLHSKSVPLLVKLTFSPGETRQVAFQARSTNSARLDCCIDFTVLHNELTQLLLTLALQCRQRSCCPRQISRCCRIIIIIFSIFCCCCRINSTLVGCVVVQPKISAAEWSQLLLTLVLQCQLRSCCLVADRCHGAADFFFVNFFFFFCCRINSTLVVVLQCRQR